MRWRSLIAAGVFIRQRIGEARCLNHPFEQGQRCCQALTRAVAQNLAAVSVWITPRKKAEAELIRLTMLPHLLFSLIDAFIEIISRAVIRTIPVLGYPPRRIANLRRA
jgi:hypothetical protein